MDASSDVERRKSWLILKFEPYNTGLTSTSLVSLKDSLCPSSVKHWHNIVQLIVPNYYKDCKLLEETTDGRGRINNWRLVREAFVCATESTEYY